MIARVLIALGCIVSPALADPPVIKGTYALDQLKMGKCRKVEGMLLRRLTVQYTCAAPEPTGAPDTPPVAVCTAKKGLGEYLLFERAADCNHERDRQLSNME
jgi:hypothetical protein